MMKKDIRINQPVDELLGLIVHSYNNYFAGINGFNELAMLQNKDEGVDEMLGLSLRSGESAAHFGKTLLASIERLQVNNSPTKLKQLITALEKFECELVSNTNSYDEMEIKVNIEWFIECANEIIHFLNCLRAESESIGSLQLNIEYDDSMVLTFNFTVSGVTLSCEQQASLFELFYSSKKMFNGTGVGLAKVKGYFSQIGGAVTWQEKQGIIIKIPVLG